MSFPPVATVTIHCLFTERPCPIEAGFIPLKLNFFTVIGVVQKLQHCEKISKGRFHYFDGRDRFFQLRTFLLLFST